MGGTNNDHYHTNLTPPTLLKGKECSMFTGTAELSVLAGASQTNNSCEGDNNFCDITNILSLGSATIMAGPQSEIVQKLERMGNLESVLAEQRMRMEKLKTTYEMLKAEHLQLKDVRKIKLLFPRNLRGIGKKALKTFELRYKVLTEIKL